ncbi:MAG: YeeE/YedE family protein [Burkholderiaceae bacterium]|nr:YeeE/YedE family protein [Burkholderiaceae bacterium]
MVTAEDIPGIESTVVLIGLGIGLVLGWVSRFSNFCTVGAISDWYASGDQSRFRMWMLAIAIAIIGTQALILGDLIAVKDSFYTAPAIYWLSYILGGLLFGFGMVLASGCGARNLVRIGGGSLKAMVVFLVMAVFAYMTMRGIFGVIRVASIEKIAFSLGTRQDLPSLLGQPRAIVCSVVALVLFLYVFMGAELRRRPRLILGGLIIGALVVAGWWATGHVGFVAEDPNTLEPRFLATNTRGVESLTFVAPLAYWLDLLMFWSDKSRGLTFSVATVTGVVIGSLIHALSSRTFRWEGFVDRADLARHMVGAAMMGIGGVVAFGCTIGQGITGVSLLALGSLMATAAIIGGAWLGLRWAERHA